MRIPAFLAAGAALAAAALVGLVAATPAYADAGDIVIATAQGSTTSVAKKGVFIDCPAGTHVLGGGGYVWNGARRVHLASSVPYLDGDDPDQWWVGAAEIRPTDYTSAWRVYGYAICGPELPGLEYISQESLVNSNSTRHATVTCPGTKKLLSAGGEIAEQAEHVVLDDIAITSDLKSVDVWGIERGGGTTYSWSVLAYGVCVNNNAVTDLHRVQTTSGSSLTDKTQNASCGAQQVYGIGFSQATAAGHTMVQSAVVSETAGYVGVVADPTGAPNPWSVATQLVCGDE